MSEWKRFAVERRNDGVTIITMTRPEKLNAMDQLWFAELTALMNGLGSEQDPTRVAVLTGQGRAFSAGGDIDMFHDLAGDVSRVRPHLRRVYDAFHAVERCAVPVIAAVNGIAYGGGTELTMACDMALAGENARFCCKEAAVGLMPGYGIVRGAEVIGRPWTRYLALSGRIIDAATAERIGLVQHTVPDADLLPAALTLAEEVAAHPSLAVRVGKAYLNRGTHDGFDESVEAIALLFGTTEHAEAVAAFRARRAGN
ncbi:enoyl-CoA hydratase/isomerase family protein [Granulicoccus phenolivorans]|uniref:enoyl-CoA hydratase/isomerase family protein n=1 Tax=Granulicoccus phenolivorans TaxID=266854 RepID=UPI0004037BC5|nr:enoyl-CoA hydratase/isomerase family protein [Granulicoccus phenolivorans]